jgi:hypothetical protein
MNNPFVVFSLPRSRSAWLSVLLSGPGAVIGHDSGPQTNNVAEFIAAVDGGTCETGAAFAWPLIRRMLPDAKFAVVRRDPAQVVQSLARFGLHGYEDELADRVRQLDQISAQPGTLSVEFEDLANEDACAQLYDHCLGRPMPRGWWRHLDPINIQVDMRRQLQLLASRQPQIAALKAEAQRLMAYV